MITKLKLDRLAILRDEKARLQVIKQELIFSIFNPTKEEKQQIADVEAEFNPQISAAGSKAGDLEVEIKKEVIAKKETVKGKRL